MCWIHVLLFLLLLDSLTVSEQVPCFYLQQMRWKNWSHPMEDINNMQHLRMIVYISNGHFYLTL